MSVAHPVELAAQAQAVAETARRCADYFRQPSPEALRMADAARESCAARSKTARERLKGSHDKAREAWLAACGGLDRAGDLAWRAASEAQRFSAGAEALLPLASPLALAAEAVAAAASQAAKPQRCAEALVEAKKLALEVERAHRHARRAAIDDPRFVDGLKARSVAQRLSDAAEALQQAADALVEGLAQETA